MKTLKKLRNLRNHIEIIPKKNIALDLFVTKEGKKKSYRDWVMCPASWTAMNTWNGKGLNLEEDGEYWIIRKGEEENFKALGTHFGITESQAHDLFGPRYSHESYGSEKEKSDKKIFLKRIDDLIATLHIP